LLICWVHAAVKSPCVIMQTVSWMVPVQIGWFKGVGSE
jgi:hypothetical protein